MFKVQPKKLASPAKSTMAPTLIDNNFSLRLINKIRPNGPPKILPRNRNLKGFQSTSFFSRWYILNAIGSPKRLSICGTNKGSINTKIGDAITANPNPKTPWTAAVENNKIEIKTISNRERSNGYVN